MIDNLLTQMRYAGAWSIGCPAPAGTRTGRGMGRAIDTGGRRKGAGAAALSLAFGCLLAVSGTGPSLAQDPAPDMPQLRLEDLTRAIRENEERARALQSEVSAIAADRAELNRRLIDTADRIKASETQIAAAEDRLKRLSERELLLRASLKARRKTLAELLAALQRIGRTPPPAVVVRPQDALAAIRSAALLGAVVPELRVDAQKLSEDLTELISLRDAIAAEKEQLAANTHTLAEERVRIEALINSKRSTLASTQADLVETRRRTEELGHKTQTLKELIARMDAEVALPTAPESAQTPDSDGAAAAAAQPPQRIALSDPARIRPAMAFTSTQGLLPLPVSGTQVRAFGDPDGFGGITRGVQIQTRPTAQVTSPSDGWVVYAGAFRSYGQLLIVNAGDGYHVILAGLEHVNVELGQFVLAGEPVGVMGRSAGSGPAAVAGAAGDRPVLYVEFRKDGNSIDPTPWWASLEEKVRG